MLQSATMYYEYNVLWEHIFCHYKERTFNFVGNVGPKHLLN